MTRCERKTKAVNVHATLPIDGSAQERTVGNDRKCTPHRGSPAACSPFPQTHHPSARLRAHLSLVLGVERLKLLAPAVCEARRLVGAEERPLRVVLHAPHEQVGDPEPVEEVARAGLLLRSKQHVAGGEG